MTTGPDTRAGAAPRAVFLVTNDMRNDSRLKRHAAAATRTGYDVTVLALRSPAASRDSTTPEGYAIRRIGPRFHDHPVYMGSRGLLRTLRVMTRSVRPTVAPDPGPPDSGGPSPSLKRRIRDQLEWRYVEALGRSFARHLMQLQPQVVVSNDLDTLVPAARHAREHPHTRLVHDVHDLMADVNAHRSTWWTPTLHEVESRHLDAADAVLTVNPGLARVIGERYPDAAVAVVRNAVSLEFGVPPPETTPSPGPLRLAYSGGLGPRHGLLTLIDAMARLPEGTTSLDIYGFGELADVLPEVARARVPGSRVTVHPPLPQNELIVRLNACEVGVLPLQSRELNVTLSTPNKLYEYMAAGLAVATFDGDEAAGLVRETGSGDAFDARDPGAIAAALDRFRRDPDHLAGCRARAWDAFRTRFNWEHERATFLAALAGPH